MELFIDFKMLTLVHMIIHPASGHQMKCSYCTENYVLRKEAFNMCLAWSCMTMSKPISIDLTTKKDIYLLEFFFFSECGHMIVDQITIGLFKIGTSFDYFTSDGIISLLMVFSSCWESIYAFYKAMYSALHE